VSRYMSYQLLYEMEEWEEDTDVLLHHLPIVGCAFRKVWRSETLGRNKSEMVPAIHLVVNNKVRSLDEAPAVTHEIFLYPQDIEERKLNGTFLDIDLPAPVTEGQENDEDAPHMFLEQHKYLDLDEDGYKEPYIVTVHKESCQVVRIVANFSMEAVKDNGKKIVRIAKEQYFVKYSFIPDPKGGFYDIGFGRLLESLGETIDTTINQMLDAGHLQNAGGGFIGTGIRLKKGGQIKVSPGRFEQVEMTGKLGDQIHMHQFQGPSAVLFNLLGMMIEAAKDITAVKDILTGDTNGQTQTATTTLAMIEQGLKVFTAIYKRIYRALKDEFRLLFDLNAKHIDEKAYLHLQRRRAGCREVRL
jgi:chaperonin GroES